MSVVPVHLSDHRGTSAVHRVSITVTRMRSGGIRPWYRCPRCSRRAGKLYATSVEVLACRLCLKLVYRSQYRKKSLWERVMLAMWNL